MTSRAGSIAAGLAVFLSVLLVGGRAAGAGFGATPAGGTYDWPVTGPVIHGFELPNGQYGAGHRGIDIAAPFGSPVHAAEAGTVSFAGWVAGALFVSIDHPDGYRSTYSWVSAISVHKGDVVTRGQVVASSGHGHPEVPSPTHLHFGVRLGSQYVDPMLFLEPGSVVDLIHLAPLGGAAGAADALGAGLGDAGWALPLGRSDEACADPRMTGHPCLLSFDAARRTPVTDPAPP